MTEKIFASLFVFIISLSLNISCDNTSVSPESVPVYERGYMIVAEDLDTYTPEQINQILTILDLNHDLTLQYSVKVIRVEYQTSDSEDKLLRASGAIMVPQSSSTLPILSINHGTVVKRTNVASEGPLSSVEGVVGLITASLGYLTCVPDYLGYGVSKEIHPYVHAKSLAISIIDMIRATIRYSNAQDINISNQLFLAGYSEGGYATLATQKEIEESYSMEFNLTAVAPMEGPYDLSSVVNTILNKETYPSPVYIAFLLTAYNDIYGWNRLADIFNSPYASMMKDFFDGTRSYSEIHNQLPKKVTTLLKAEFVTNYLNGEEPEVQSVMEANTLLNWSPQARIKFFHGNADEDVPYSNVLNTVENLKVLTDQEISLVTIEGGTHASSGLPCILGMINWFEQIRNDIGKPYQPLAIEMDDSRY